MHIIRYIFFLLCSLTFSIFVDAQSLTSQPGELLVRLEPGVQAKQWVARWQSLGSKPTQLVAVEQLSKQLNIWRFQFDPAQIEESHFIREMQRKDQDVRHVQRNHFFHQRLTEPDDPQFSEQWQYVNTGQGGGAPGADLDIDQAWDITTGGLTALGDTIVVCVIDDGLDPTHTDFGDNIWVNHAEIPNNGIDDDQNGYVDDYQGWNARRNNDDIDDDNTHGTPVAGIIGAKGNNGLGVSGVNWNVKLMIVVGGIRASLESDYIKAFEYPLTQRKLYNESEGKKGAFVVATNGSWGVDKAKAEDFPLWSEIYDTLGTYGILNVGAVNNDSNVDIDELGDMPASSSSSYLLAVTNIDYQDLKVEGAAFGAATVDLGAYGGTPDNGVWTTKNNNSYGRFPGTSAATPHVAGAIGLLYSAPCQSFASLAQSDPSGAAALVKAAILDGTTPISALDGITLTGGKLNIFNSLQLLLQDCASCFPASTLLTSDITDVSAVLSWNVNDSISRIDLRWKAVDSTEWQVLNDVSSPYTLNGLVACTNYEFQLNTFCGDTELGFSDSWYFKSDGCCAPPENLRLILRQEDRFFIRWDPVLASIGYEVRLREMGSESWDTLRANRDGSFALAEGQICTEYEMQARTLCEGENSDFSTSLFVQTLGCGFCIDMASKYCNVGRVDGSEEWIAGIQLAGLDHASAGGEGFSDFSGLEPPVLNRENFYDILVNPGASGQVFGRYTEVYIDFDQNGVFGTGELAYTSGRVSGVVNGEIAIPAAAMDGITRMRVSMLSRPNIGPCPGSSEQFGEVEDYCVRIEPPVSTRGAMDNGFNMNVFPNPFRENLSLRVDLPASESSARIILYDARGRSLQQWERRQLSQGEYEETLSIQHWPAGLYWIAFEGQRHGRAVRRIVKK